MYYIIVKYPCQADKYFDKNYCGLGTAPACPYFETGASTLGVGTRGGIAIGYQGDCSSAAGAGKAGTESSYTLR